MRAMRHFGVAFLGAALLGCSESSAPSGGPDAAVSTPAVRPPLEQILPAETFLYVSVPNAPARGEEYKKSNLNRLVSHAEVKRFVEPIEKMLNKMIDEDQTIVNATGLTFREFWDLLGGPLEIAVFEAAVEGQQMPNIVLALGAKDTSRLREAANKVEAALAKQPGMEKTERDVKGHTLYSVGPDGTGFHYAVLEKTIFASLSSAHVEALIQRSADEKKDGLAAASNFVKARGKLSPKDRHLALVFANLSLLWERFGDQIPPEGRPIIENLGLKDISAFGLALEYDLPQIRERYIFLTERQDRGLVKLMAGKPGTDEAIAYVPRDAVSYSHFNLSLGEIFDTVVEAVKHDPDMTARLNQSIEEMNSQLGVDLRKDVLGALGSSWTLYGRSAADDPMKSDTVVIVPLKDGKGLFGLLDKMAEGEESPFRRFEHGGVKAYSYTFEIPKNPAGGPFPPGFPIPEAFSIVLFAKDGWLFAAVTTDKPEAVIERTKKGSSTIRDNPRFAGILAKTPKDAEAVMTYDLGASVAPLLKMLEALPPEMIGQVKNPETGESLFDAKRLPKEATLKELLGVAVTFKRTESDAIVIESVSDVGATSFSAVMVAGIGAALMLPAITRATSQAKVTSCMNNLSQLWKMQNIYMSQFGGRLKKMPSETGSAFWLALSKTEPPLIDPLNFDIYVCPVVGFPPPGTETSYLGPKQEVGTLKAGDIVGCCAPGNHPDGSITVLMNTGDVLKVGPGDPLFFKALQSTKR